jgi:hypothetical protein
MSAMLLMMLGEATAPIMNVLRITNIAATLETADWLLAFHPFVEYAFALLYVSFRVLVGPICSLHLTHDLMLTKEGRRNVPLQLSIVWVAMCWGVLLGSVPWIKNALDILCRGSVIA